MPEVALPELGEGIEKATLTYWYFKEGDKVGQNDELAEFTTDKATFNLPSPSSGILSKIFFNEGDTVKIGEKIAVIDTVSLDNA
ncbi:MAG: lipoyl domain-containing protein [Candidatus Omnitrophota bacterium]